MQLSERHQEYWRKNLRLTAVLLAIWFVVTFVVIYFAPELNEIVIMGFPFAFYMAAQGSLIIYVLVIWFYARRMNKLDQEFGVHEGEEVMMAPQSQSQFFQQLKKYYTFYTGGFIAFVIVLAILEQMGLPNKIHRLHLPRSPPSACMPASASCPKPPTCRNTTSPDAAYPPCSTAWRPAPTGCLPRPSSVWPARCTLSGL